MEIKKLDNILPEMYRNRSTIKKDEIIVAKIVKRITSNSLMVEIKGKNYTALIKEKISGDMFLARVVKLSPKLVLKFIKSLGKNSIKYNIGNYFFNYKKEFIQKLITSDNFVVGNFLNTGREKILESKNDIIPLLKKYLSGWYTPILKESFLKKSSTSYFQKIYSKFLVFQSLYNIYNLEHLSFLMPLRIWDKNSLLSMEILNRKNDLSQSLLVKIYLDRNSEILFLIYLDQKLVSCSLSSNNNIINSYFEKEVKFLYENMKSKMLSKKLEINIVPFDYLAKIDERTFKNIDIRM